MSRIGNNPITIPEGVNITVTESNEVIVKGPKGELRQQMDKDMSLQIEDGKGLVKRPSEQKRHKAYHGLYRALIANMVEGVSKGFTRKLEIVGVGYRAISQGQKLELNVGYSHPVVFAIPSEVKLLVDAQKGKNPVIVLESIDKQLVGQIAAKIRSIRKPEPYKGKGIKYVEEVLRRKAGKVVAAT